MLISSVVDEILQAFRLPQNKQQLALPQLLRKLKVLLEGHYHSTKNGGQGKTFRGPSNNVMGGPGGMRQGKSALSHLQMLDE